MNWDRIAGNWTQWKGRVKERWGRLSDDHLDVIGGKREQLAGRIQEIYGLSSEAVERQLRNWERGLSVEEFDEADSVTDDESEPTNRNGRGSR